MNRERAQSLARFQRRARDAFEEAVASLRREVVVAGLQVPVKTLHAIKLGEEEPPTPEPRSKAARRAELARRQSLGLSDPAIS